MAKGIVVIVVALTMACEVAAVSLATDSTVVRVAYAVYAVTQAAAGALIVWRHPRHVIGWLLAGSSLWNAAFGDAVLAYGQRASLEGWPLAEQAQLTGLTSWIIAGAFLWGLFLLFPDGRLPGRRWWAVPIGWAVGAALAIPGQALNPGFGSEFESGVNPFARDDIPSGPMFALGAALIGGTLLLSVVALALRFRRSGGVERQQIKWVLLVAGVLGVLLPVSSALWTAWPPIQVLVALTFPLLPIAACVALLRYHLYDVDLVVSRTVSWGLLTVTLFGGYAAVVLMAGLVFASPASAALGALVVAVAFRPLRDRLQNAVDRRFRRARYEVRRAMTDFVDRVRRGEAAADDVEHALRSAVGDPDLELVLRPRSIREVAPGRTAATAGPAVVIHRVEDSGLVADASNAGRLAIEIAALQGELRHQLTELEASRSRIVAVADEERHKIARDLHDGAQQRLVAIGLGLRHVQHRLGDDAAEDVSRDLDGAVAEITNAITELRSLAGGLRPAALESGLGAALRDLAARTPVTTTVRTTTERFRPDLEAVAWFVACEAVTNAVKHARAAALTVEVSRDGDSLLVAIGDDGRGGAEVGRGSGLLGLSDRVLARGGTLTVDSPAGVGTRLEARLPCG